MLDAGDPAPDFYLPDVADGSAEYMLSAAANQSPVVVAFVSGGHVADGLDALAGVDWATMADRLAVFALVPDTAAGRVPPDFGGPFPVLVDYDSFTAERYGLADDTAVALFVVDGRCRIQFSWASADPTDEVPVDALKSALRSL